MASGLRPVCVMTKHFDTYHIILGTKVKVCDLMNHVVKVNAQSGDATRLYFQLS